MKILCKEFGGKEMSKGSLVNKILEGDSVRDTIAGICQNESIVKEPDGTESVLITFPKHNPHVPFIHNGERCHAQIVTKVPKGNYRKTVFTSPGYTVYVNMDEVNKNMRFNPYAFIAIPDNIVESSDSYKVFEGGSGELTVGELRSILSRFDADTPVVIKSSNSRYVDNVKGVRSDSVRAMWRADFDAVIISGKEQVGSI